MGGGSGGPSVVEVTGISGGIVPEGLREADVTIRSDEPFKLRSDLVEDVSPATLVVAAQNGRLLLVHLQIFGEDGPSRQDPTPSPIPPFPNRSARVLSHGGY